MESKLREIIKKRFALSDAEIALLISRAPVSYKSYRIRKKNGGFRKISQPAKEIKALQRWIIDAIFNKLDVHPAATAYEISSSIKENASRHLENDYFIKLDFKNFFNSIKKEDIEFFLKKKSIKLNDQDLSDLVRILCIKDSEALCLSIGAPSSPKVSNVILYEFDEKISDWCSDKKITYTRYADDLTFSTKEKNMGDMIEEKVFNLISNMEHPRLELNFSKRISVSKKDWVSVTGITLTSRNELSVGRKRKRLVRTMIFKHTQKSLEKKELDKLNGLIAFIEYIEPGFKKKMLDKYGDVDELYLTKPVLKI